VFYFDGNGTQRSFATNLTDVLPPDAFLEASAAARRFAWPICWSFENG